MAKLVSEEDQSKKKSFGFFSSLWSSAKDTFQTIKENPWKSLAIGITSILVPPVGITLASVVGAKTIANVVNDYAVAKPDSRVGKFVSGVKKSTVGRFISGTWKVLKKIDEGISNKLKPLTKAIKGNPKSVGIAIGLSILSAALPPAIPFAVGAWGVAAYNTYKTYKKQATEKGAAAATIASQRQQPQETSIAQSQTRGQTQTQGHKEELESVKQQLAAANQKLAEMTVIMKNFQQKSTATKPRARTSRVNIRSTQRKARVELNSR